MRKVNIFDIVKPYDNDMIVSMDREFRKECLNYLNKLHVRVKRNIRFI